MLCAMHQHVPLRVCVIMRKSWLTLAALCACVAALGLFVWLKPPKSLSQTTAVTTLKAADARTLRVQRKDATQAVLEKRGNDWHLTEPVKAPADGFQVLRLLAVLDARGATEYPVSDAARFDLDPPHTELIINDQRFGFGAINTVTREQYLLANQRIFPVETRFAAAIPGNAHALIRRSVFAQGDVPVRFDFGAFTVALDEKKWTTTPKNNNASDMSQADYHRRVAQWREGSALRSGLAGTQPATRAVTVTLKDGAKVALGIVQTEPELIVRRADLGLQFVFTGDIGKQMLALPIVRK